MHLTVTCTCQSKITKSAHELSYGADEVMSSSRTLVGLVSGQWQNGWLDLHVAIIGVEALTQVELDRAR